MQKYLAFILFIAFSIWACDKEEISRGNGTAEMSFASFWQFTTDFQVEKNDGLVFFRMDQINDPDGLIYRILISYIPLVEDSFYLYYVPPLGEKKPKADFYVMVDEDAVGEEYEIDSSNLSKCYIILDCISKRSISGKFNIYFKLSKYSHPPKLDPTIPDSFFIENGIFNAEKL